MDLFKLIKSNKKSRDDLTVYNTALIPAGALFLAPIITVCGILLTERISGDAALTERLIDTHVEHYKLQVESTLESMKNEAIFFGSSNNNNTLQIVEAALNDDLTPEILDLAVYEIARLRATYPYDYLGVAIRSHDGRFIPVGGTENFSGWEIRPIPFLYFESWGVTGAAYNKDRSIVALQVSHPVYSEAKSDGAIARVEIFIDASVVTNLLNKVSNLGETGEVFWSLFYPRGKTWAELLADVNPKDSDPGDYEYEHLAAPRLGQGLTPDGMIALKKAGDSQVQTKLPPGFSKNVPDTNSTRMGSLLESGKNYQGEDVFWGADIIDGTNWVITVSQHRKEALAPYFHELWAELGSWFFGFVVSISLLYRFIIKPTHELKVKVEKKAGQLNIPTPSARNELVALESYFEEITEALESQRDSAKKELAYAAELSRLGRFAAQASHDVTPLMESIENCMESLKLSIEDGQSQKEIIEDIDLIRGDLSVVIKFVSNLRSAINEAGRATDVALRQCPKAELRTAIRSNKQITEKNNITIKQNIDIPEGCCFFGSDNAVGMAISNIIHNAAQEIAEKGASIPREIKITAYVSKESFYNQTLNIQISDTGRGMDERKQENMGKEGWSTKETGTGRGISGAIRTLEAVDGKIKFSNRKRDGLIQGLDVIITIPVCVESEAERRTREA